MWTELSPQKNFNFTYFLHQKYQAVTNTTKLSIPTFFQHPLLYLLSSSFLFRFIRSFHQRLTRISTLSILLLFHLYPTSQFLSQSTNAIMGPDTPSQEKVDISGVQYATNCEQENSVIFIALFFTSPCTCCYNHLYCSSMKYCHSLTKCSQGVYTGDLNVYLTASSCILKIRANNIYIQEIFIMNRNFSFDARLFSSQIFSVRAFHQIEMRKICSECCNDSVT